MSKQKQAFLALVSMSHFETKDLYVAAQFFCETY